MEKYCVDNGNIFLGRLWKEVSEKKIKNNNRLKLLTKFKSYERGQSKKTCSDLIKIIYRFSKLSDI